MDLPVLNEDLATCAACGGHCCKTLPGAFMPDQFTDLEAQLRRGLAAGELVLAWWDGDPRPQRNCFDLDCPGCDRCDAERLYRTYYVRPRTDGSTGVLDRSHRGVCNFLTPSGCRLGYADRPAGCQSLIADPARAPHCRDHAEPERALLLNVALAWVPHQDLMVRLAQGD